MFASATLVGCSSAGTTHQRAEQPPVQSPLMEAPPVEPPTSPPDAAPIDSPVTSTGTGSVQGVVTNDSGARMPGIHVELVRTGARLATITDAAGRYVFQDVPAGNARIEVRVSDNPRQGPLIQEVTVVASTVAISNVTVISPRPNRTNVKMPYGAPPARQRLV